MRLLIFATDWGEVGVIVAIIVGAAAILVAIGVGIYTVRATRAKARIKVKAYSDETGHIAVVVSNERGTNSVTVTSVSPIVQGNLLGPGTFVATTLGAGETRQWDFDIDKQHLPEAQVRVDSGRKHWIVRPEAGEVIVSGPPSAV